MTNIKLCGLSRMVDIEVVNVLKPEYIGFIFVPQSKRYVSIAQASVFKKVLDKKIKAVGVFVDEDIDIILDCINLGIIDMVQLHGHEDENTILKLKALGQRPIIKAFKIESQNDCLEAEKSSADYILLDSGSGSGKVFDWELIKDIKREYFLAGGLDVENVEKAIRVLKPYAVDVSSGLETDGLKDKLKMEAFVYNVRKVEE